MPNVFKALSDPIFRQDVKRGVMDALNRGMVAGGLGAPVDLATMALRPFGYNVEKPVGGSEWIGDKMRQAGMVSDQRNALAEAAAGMLAPTGYADPIATGRAVAGLVGAAQMAGPAQKAATVWHGTPHKFDKFDSSKIGSGAGTQAYGYGLYFAGDAKQASAYTGANGVLNEVDLPDEQLAKMVQWDQPMEKQPEAVRKAFGELVREVVDSGAADRASRDLRYTATPYSRQDLIEEMGRREGWSVKGGDLIMPNGKIADEKSIQAALKQKQRGKVFDTAGDVYRAISEAVGSDSAVSAALAARGIPGSRYGHVGAENAVVFPGYENVLRIISQKSGGGN